MQGSLRIESFDYLVIFFTLLKILIDNFLHVVVLFCPVEVYLMFFNNCNGICMFFVRLLTVKITFIARQSRIQSHVD